MEQRVLPYGEGPCKLRIRHMITYDGAGHGSPHFEIVYVQSKEPAGEATEAQDSATSELGSIYEELPGRKTAVALFEAVQKRGLSHSRAACRLFVGQRARS